MVINKLAVAFGFSVAMATIPFGVFAAAPAPMPAMDMSGIDCATAPAKMMSMMTPPADAMNKMPTDTDAAYTAMMKMMVMHAAMMSKIEMKCGKNPKVMAMAQKMEGQLDDNYLTVEALQNGF
jgi:hypothetical protein